MNSAMPRYRFKSVLDITIEDLHKMGARAIALDIDNTICNDGKENCIDGLEDWLAKVQNAGFKIMIISNAIGKRPRRVAEKLGLAHLSFARKPKAHKLLAGAELMGVEINEMAMIGDQIFADIMAANRCGAIPVLVDALQGETRFPIFYANRRRKEKPIIEEFEKLHGYGVYDE